MVQGTKKKEIRFKVILRCNCLYPTLGENISFLTPKELKEFLFGLIQGLDNPDTFLDKIVIIKQETV
jgi:hypothetical protein